MSTTQPQRGGRQPRTGSGGGRALMLLGVLLALLSGVLVIYLVSNATSNAGATEPVVVATQPISAGQVLDSGSIQSDFAVKNYPLSLVPPGAYIYTTQDALDVRLNQFVVVTDIQPGDVLLATDSRFVPRSSAPPNSITFDNPSAIPTGSMLFSLDYADPNGNGQSFVVAGDHVDVIVTECGSTYDPSGGCATQTTLTNLYVYATFSSSLIVVVTPTQAKELKFLAATGNMSLAVLKPNDSGTDGGAAIDAASVAATFHF